MTNFISISSKQTQIKMKNLFNTAIFIWFLWLLFHFTIIFFFWLVLKSVLLVWIFLWLWNFVALLVDIPIWALQKYIKPKTFLLISNTFMLLVILIFIKFIYFEWLQEIFNWWDGFIWETINYLTLFLNSTLNIFLLIIAACMYWVIKESYDVTTLSYIFNNSTPSEYANYISKYSIHFWIWALVWLILSWVLLAFNIKIAIIVFLILITLFYIFIIKYFDNVDDTITLNDLKSIKLDISSSGLYKKKDELIKKINTKSLIELSKQTKIIILKPIEIRKNIDFKDVFDTVINNTIRFKTIIFWLPRNLILLWILLVMMHYGFWDTFVSTFQVQFLEKIISVNKDTLIISQTWWLISWYVLLWLIVIPAFLLQDFFINLSKKYWSFKIIMFWTIISCISVFFFWLVDKIYFVILFWLLNSIWYAASMPISQANFSEIYNTDYAKKYNLKEIDTTVSAAPLKVLLNAANVIWVILWWLFVWIFWFNGFFILFSFLLWWLFIYSLINMKNFDSKSNNDIEKKEDEEIDIDFV